mmetsp:Transcript_13072/g.30990  ORF Transcript_13072/g.30990 Transcript_13072/m.30990 type:complete len:245 (+) Transcript_13072:134-868(+)
MPVFNIISCWLSVLALFLAGQISAVSSLSLVGRKLKAECRVDNCGIWCGPPRPPPCGTAYATSSSSSTPRHETGNRDTPQTSKPQYPETSDNPRQYTPPPPVAENPYSDYDPKQNKDSPPEDREAGCYGDLPFGLENCVCDGAKVGEAAGLAACGRVYSECQAVAPFDVNNELEAVQRVCDTFALDSCMSAAQSALAANSGCAELVRFGSSTCTAEEAMRIFMQSVEQQCEPLCSDCPRHPDKP